MQGGHHVAHRLIKTTLPFNECNEMVLPFSSLNFKSGVCCVLDTNGFSPLVPCFAVILPSMALPLIAAYAHPVIAISGSRAIFLMFIFIILFFDFTLFDFFRWFHNDIIGWRKITADLCQRI